MPVERGTVVAPRRRLPSFVLCSVDVPVLGRVAEGRAGTVGDADAAAEIGQAGVEDGLRGAPGEVAVRCATGAP
jgi:hypothetical protein